MTDTQKRWIKRALGVLDPLAPRPEGPLVLVYHQVGVDLGREMEVSLDAFERQMVYLAARGSVVDIDTAWTDRRRGAVVLSFDDGFADVYEHAFPVLHRLGLPFTLFLTTGPVESGRPLDARYPDAAPLTWDQIEDMHASSLMTVGAHTHTHRPLLSLGRGELEEDLATCDVLIERRLGVRPRHFAYPWGAWFEEVVPIVSARYDTAWTGGGWSTAWNDPYRLPRAPIQRSDDPALFRRKVMGGQRLEYGLRDALVRRAQRRQGSPAATAR